MPSLLQRIFPISPTKNCDSDDDDEFSVEYSFAAEYSGPPVNFKIPQAIPVDFDRIPTASVLSKSILLCNLPPLPVIQPILDGDNLKEFILGSEIDFSSDLGEIDDSGTTQFLDCTGVSFPSPDGVTSSDTLGFSDNSKELSGSSEIEVSSDITSIRDNDNIDESQCDVVDSKSEVTFHDPESTFIVEGTGRNSPQEQLAVKANVKKGLCHRCHKKNRFSEKEGCIVCGAKYCAHCLVRAMGSMPEGRKCLTCIGSPIDESKRGNLGRCSRLLRQVLSDLEVKQIMHSELSCEANQVPPELVYVNDKPLCHEELVLLQTCPNPPKKLKAGKYWYDKVAGYWGKVMKSSFFDLPLSNSKGNYRNDYLRLIKQDGEKPCQIITAQLAVGDAIKQNASNGNTSVLINNREITKAELRMLQWAGIRCEGCPSFWVSADGSCLEEGQKNVMGRLWDKKGIRLVCTFLSLPSPPDCGQLSGEEVDADTNATASNFAGQKTLKKILIVGHNKSGASTIFKQARMVYNVPFSADERQDIKHMIQCRLYGYLGVLLEAREQFEEESTIEMEERYRDQPGPSDRRDRIAEKSIYSINPRMKAFSDWLLQVMISGNLDMIFPAASREYAPLVEELWKDQALQATYSRRNELQMLPRVASYFLDRAVEISRADYEPSDTDILYCEGITSSNGIASMEFSFPNPPKHSLTDPADQNNPLHRYQLIKVHASSLGGNCKWLEMFEDADLVMYCVSLTDYDQFSEDNVNKMLASKRLFEKIVTHPTFQGKDFLLVLNKFDLLEEKIEESPLAECEWFHDFDPVISVNRVTNATNPSLAQRAFHYVAVKFKRLFRSLSDRKLYVSVGTALEPDSVDEALRYAREIMKWEEEKPVSSAQDWSSGSMEATSSS